MQAQLVTGVLAVSLLTVMAAQSSEPKVRVVFPEEGGYVVGEIVIKASIEPRNQPVERMTFFVDGRLVCTVERPPFECAWNAGGEVREHGFRVVARLADGRRVAQNARTQGIEYADSVDVPIVHVTTSVTDGSRFIGGLTREDFRVYEDDARQPITYFAAENIPLELIVGVDVSGSMAPAIEEVKANVKRFLAALRPTDRVWLAGFNENFFIAARPSTDLATRSKAVDRLASWGMTSLYEVIIRSFDLLGKQSGRRGLVIFTDGEDTSSRVPREAVERRAEKSDAVLYMIGQGRAIVSVPLRALCERLAERSGGRAFFAADSGGLRRAFDEVLDELSNQYLLGYVPPSPQRDSKWHRIRVEVNCPGCQVRARQGYVF